MPKIIVVYAVAAAAADVSICVMEYHFLNRIYLPSNFHTIRLDEKKKKSSDKMAFVEPLYLCPGMCAVLHAWDLDLVVCILGFSYLLLFFFLCGVEDALHSVGKWTSTKPSQRILNDRGIRKEDSITLGDIADAGII